MPDCLQCHTSLPASRFNLRVPPETFTTPTTTAGVSLAAADDPPPTPTPEPSTLLLVGVTLAYLGRRLTRR